MNALNREEITLTIVEKLEKHKDQLSQDFKNKRKNIPFFVVDDLLPANWCKEINEAFPDTSLMVLKKSIREHKFVGVQIDLYEQLIGEVTYAFQDKRIVDLIGEICGINKCYADASLYAGGISTMVENQFLKPHLDNSHDQQREKWRVLNLLYYTTPDWETSFGGNLEVWPNGLKKEPTTIRSRFNRLVVMGTDSNSWHAVSKVVVNKHRNCVSNYYFSETPLSSDDSFHVTLFRGWSKQKWDDMLLRLDGVARMAIRKIFKKGIVKNPHVYNKKPSKKT